MPLQTCGINRLLFFNLKRLFRGSAPGPPVRRGIAFTILSFRRVRLHPANGNEYAARNTMITGIMPSTLRASLRLLLPLVVCSCKTGISAIHGGQV